MERIPSEFVAKMSHDLKTPVGNAMMYTELMTEDLRGLIEDHPELDDRLSSLINFCGNIHLSSSKLINSIQSWGISYQIEDGVYEINKSPINLKELTEKVISGNAVFIKGKALDVTLDYQSGQETYQSDQELMFLVIDNLMTLFISMTRNNNAIRVVVDDDKGGIRFRFIVADSSFNDKLISMYRDDLTIKDRIVPEQGILKPGGYGLLFTNIALRFIGAERDVDDEGSGDRSFWFRLPLS